MKKTFLIIALGIAGSSVWAQDFTAPQHRGNAPTRRSTTQRPSEGAVQRTIRSGAPLQMLNPFAPKEYGDGRESIYYDDSNYGYQNGQNGVPRAKGIKLFSFVW